jgi:hypothetical protein
VVLVATAAAAAEGRPAPGVERLEAVGIELVRLPPPTRDRLVQELQDVLAPGGVGLGWRWAAAGGETRPAELRIVFLGSRGRGAHAGGRVLAAAGLSGPVASVWVYVPNVALALGLRPDVPPESLRGLRELGTALGRVVAHEVVHALAPEVPHGEGLLSARLHLGHLAFDAPRLGVEGARALLPAALSWRARGGALSEAERRARAASAAASVPGAP